MQWCKNHREQEAEFHCFSCQNDFCQQCISSVDQYANKDVYICQGCGGRCESLSALADEVEGLVILRNAYNFLLQIQKIWMYPFQNKSKIFISAFFLSLISNSMGIVPPLGIILIGPFLILCSFMYLVYCIDYYSCPLNIKPPAWRRIFDVRNVIDFRLFKLAIIVIAALSILIYPIITLYLNKNVNILFWCLLLMEIYFVPMLLLCIIKGKNMFYYAFREHKSYLLVVLLWMFFAAFCIFSMFGLINEVSQSMLVVPVCRMEGVEQAIIEHFTFKFIVWHFLIWCVLLYLFYICSQILGIYSYCVDKERNRFFTSPVQK